MKRRIRLEGVSLVDPKTAPPSTGPKWCALFPLDSERFRSDFPGGSIVFDAAFFEAVLANWERAGRPPLPVDYGHDEGGIAAGWISDLRVGAAGFFEACIEWTDRARAAIAARELQCLSPTFSTNGDDPTTGKPQGPTLYGAGLLNTPFLQDLPRVAASAVPPAPAAKEQRMELKQLLALLGLPDTGTPDDVAKTLGDWKAKLAAPPQAAPAGEPDGDEAKKMSRVVELAIEPVKAKLAATEAEKLELAKRVEALEAEKTAAEVKELTTLALSKGIGKAAEFVAKLSVHGVKFAREVVEMTAGTVTMGEKGIAGDTSGTDSPEAMRATINAKVEEFVKTGLSRSAARDLATKQLGKAADAARTNSPLP